MHSTCLGAISAPDFCKESVNSAW